MKQNMRRFAALMLLLCLVIKVQSQERETDFELWLKAGGEVALSERFELSFEQQLRFRDNVGEIKNYHTELELKYRITEQLDLRFVPRYIQRNGRNGYDNFFRYQFGAGYKHKWGRLNLKHRVLFHRGP